MIYVNFVILVLTAVLAILSRKHYSKYKDCQGISGCILALGLSMGHSAWVFLNDILSLEGFRLKLEEQLRRNQIVSPKRLELMTDRFIARCLGIGVLLVFTFNLIDMGSNILRYFQRDKGNMIQREEYAGDVVEEEIYYHMSGREESLLLDISPVRLSEEEFYQEADKLAAGIKDDFLGGGKVISQDIELPVVDSKDVFLISWISDRPEILSSRGRVKLEPNQETTQVKLTMIISYYDYSVEYDFQVQVGFEEKSKDELVVGELEQALNNLENETIGEKEFYIPEEINGVELEVKKEKSRAGRFLLLGLLLAVVTIGVSVSKIREAGKRRDGELIREYPSFVDSLWLYLEAGMNVKKALYEYVSAWESEDSILVEELKYTLNQMDNGQTEYIAYEELGARLNLPVYISLMRHISQNLRMGTRDLRSLMEAQVTMAIEMKKETAKRLGEEASTKLVFPMIILLVVVMVIIMTPAFMGF